MARGHAARLSVPRRPGAARLLMLALGAACWALFPATVAAAAPAGGTAGPSVEYVSIAAAGGYVLSHGWRLSAVVVATPKSVAVTGTIMHASSAGSGEQHQWEITNLPAGSVRSIGAGSWTVNPPASKVSPVFKAFSLTFRAARHTPVACTSGSETDYTGTLSGALLLDTGFPSIGTVGSTRLSFNSHNLAVVDQSCTQRAPCGTTSTVWDQMPSLSAGMLSVGGVMTKGVDTIVLAKATKLARPANAGRADVVVGIEPPATLSGSTLVVRTRAGSLIQGSANLRTSMSEPPLSGTCWSGGTQHTQVTTTSIASVSSSLHATTLLTGTITAPHSGEGTVSQVSYR